MTYSRLFRFLILLMVAVLACIAHGQIFSMLHSFASGTHDPYNLAYTGAVGPGPYEAAGPLSSLSQSGDAGGGSSSKAAFVPLGMLVTSRPRGGQ